MMLDRELAKEIRKANGDGSREAKFKLLGMVRAAREDLSSADVLDHFGEIVEKHGRVPVAICVGVTAVMREERLNRWIVEWGKEVLDLWVNRPHDTSLALIDDNLHPSRIEEYAGRFVRVTSE